MPLTIVVGSGDVAKVKEKKKMLPVERPAKIMTMLVLSLTSGQYWVFHH